MSDDEDIPKLPEDTLRILQEFYSEQEKKNEMLQKLDTDSNTEISFDENWQLSQFWYDNDTIDSIVKAVESTLPENGSVALISCPTLYAPMKKKLDKKHNVKLFEYDRRFELYGEDFIYYDFNSPLIKDEKMHKHFDVVIADPPFLSEECLSKTCETIKILSKDKIILCTGTIMKDMVSKFLNNLQINKFKPNHKNNLGNDFSSYSNFELDELIK